jgi:hypothetical protein
MPLHGSSQSTQFLRAEKAEMASTIKHVSIESNMKPVDLEEGGGNDLGFVVVAQAVEATAEGGRAHEPSLNHSNHGAAGNPFVAGALLTVCTLIPLCIVRVCMKPEEWFPTTLNTLNIVNILLVLIRFASWADGRGQINDSSLRDKTT